MFLGELTDISASSPRCAPVHEPRNMSRNVAGSIAMIFVHECDPKTPPSRDSEDVVGGQTRSLLAGTYNIDCTDIYWWQGDFSHSGKLINQHFC